VAAVRRGKLCKVGAGHMCVCMCVYVYACVCVYVFVCVCVCARMCACKADALPTQSRGEAVVWFDSVSVRRPLAQAARASS